MNNKVIVYKIWANVNPFDPNCLEVVDSSTRNCCSDEHYINVVVPARVATLREKGYIVRVQKVELSYIDI